jgi:hypothetical protein
MRKILSFLVLVGVAGLLPVAAAPEQTSPPQPAQTVLAAAIQQANAGHKRIFLHFSASW